MARAAARTDGAGPAAAPTSHGPVAQLLIAWSPLSLVLLAYALAGWVSAPVVLGPASQPNRLGIAAHVTGPAQVDRALGGVVPTVWLQQRLASGSAQWYDTLGAIVYATHFVAFPLLTAVVWFAMRPRFRSWIAAVVAFTTIGTAGYVLYPAAPPWLASEQGEIGPVSRLTERGWELVHLDWVGHVTALGQSDSNPVAAMPSLHAGAAMLVSLFLWPVVGRRVRVALTAYVLAMAWTLVYTGEHYVVDVVAGWLVAAAALVTARALGRRGAPVPQPESACRSG